MPSMKAEFGGLILDKPIVQLPEGTARTAINVDWQTANGALGPRSSFGLFGTLGGGSTPQNITVGGLNDGQPYVFVKRGGTINGINNASITSLITGASIAERGSFFAYAGELYYFDQLNRVFYDKANGKKYECGMDPPQRTMTTPVPNGTTVSKGGAFGAAYRYAATFYDTKRDLETFPIIGDGTMFTPWITVNLTSDGVNVSGLGSPGSPNDNYDKVRIYRTRGFTETMGVTQAREFYTMRAMLVAQTNQGAGFMDLSGDSELQSRTQQLLFHGTPPPKCSVAIPFGDTIIYVEEKGSASEAYGPGMYWSLPGKPGMVPLEHVLPSGHRPNRVVTPLTGQNRSINPIQGKVTATFYNGGRTLLFTANEIYRITGSQQRPTITPMEVGIGTPHQLCVSATMSAIGLPFWDGQHVNVLNNTSVEPIDTKFGVSKIFKDLTESQRDSVRVGAFNAHSQIWAAYPNGTVSDILVMDYANNKASIFQIAGAPGVIAGMCELVHDTKKQMLVFFVDGQVYNYPNDSLMQDNSSVFNTTYQAVFGQDTLEREKEVLGLAIQMGEITGGVIPTQTVDIELRGFSADGFLKYINGGTDLPFVAKETFDSNSKNSSVHIQKYVSTEDLSSVHYGTITGNVIELSIKTVGTSKWRWETWGMQRFDVKMQGGQTALPERDMYA